MSFRWFPLAICTKHFWCNAYRLWYGVQPAIYTVVFVFSAAATPAQAEPASAAPAKTVQLDRFELAIKGYELKDRGHPPAPGSTVFVGSSTFTKWGEGLEREFKAFHAINRGFGGSTIPEVTHYADRIVIKYKPDVIVFYAGTNDIADGHSAEQVADDFKAFYKKVHAALPNAEIYFISISVAPSRLQWQSTYDEANKLIQEYINQNPAFLHFIDVRPVMLDSQGHLREDVFGLDRLHMKEAGYQLWVPVIRNALEQTQPIQGHRRGYLSH